MGCGWTNPARNRGRPPTGGHRGPSAHQPPGGEELVRRHTRPLGGVCTSNNERFGPSTQPAELLTEYARRAGLCQRLDEKGWHPANEVPSDRQTCELPSVNLQSRSGTSPPRSVHQWTARAWVPVRLTVPSDSRPSAYFLFYSPLAANESLDFPDKSETRFRHPFSWIQAQVRRPMRTASAIRPPSSAPATIAFAQCLIHSATPCGEPDPYAASAPT